MAAGPKGLEEWVGSAYLFVESSLDKVVLSDAYAQPQQKVEMYKALRTALAGVPLGVDMCLRVFVRSAYECTNLLLLDVPRSPDQPAHCFLLIAHLFSSLTAALLAQDPFLVPTFRVPIYHVRAEATGG